MKVDTSDFVSLCFDVIQMVESFDDTVLGTTEGASINSLDELTEATVNQFGDEFVFGINCSRDGIVYSIIGSPSYEYFEVSLVHTLTQDIIQNTALTEAESQQLSEQEQSKRIANASITESEISKVLQKQRNATKDVIESRVYGDLSSQTRCSFNVTETEHGDILGIEALKKVFVIDDDFTRSKLDKTIVAVTNVGKNAIFLLSDLYDLDSISPQLIEEIRE